MRPATPADRLIVALDTPDVDAALALAASLQGAVGMVKVGLELFAAAGPDPVRRLRAQGHRVFLDLKLHDIPNTVGAAARVAGGLGVSLLTVHAAGGPDMVAAAVAGAREGAEAEGVAPPVILGVTVLTSLDDAALSGIGLAGPASDAVLRLGRLAVEAGAGGLVCSPAEARSLRDALGPEVLLVTPGVRPAGSARGDQARVATPAEAVAAGADYLVIGRPIRSAPDPVAAARAIAGEIAGGG
jgi:orotidine-5'-phosphate decarboxylase